ncbi:MAG TPA: serine hydrolase [Candidatus Saccharimonadales bacterium]
MYHAKRSRSKKIAGGLAIGLVAVLLLGAWNFLRPLPPITAGRVSLSFTGPSGTPVVWPSAGEAAVEAQGVTNLMTHGAQKALPTASLAKVITALTVLQEKPLNPGDIGPSMTLTQADLDIYHRYVDAGGATIHVSPGEQLSEYQALQAMFLASANNVADSFAIWAFGSLDNYKAAATRYVKQLDLNDTTIGPDASGMSPQTTSTPADLIRLGEQALANPVLAGIMQQKEVTLPTEGHITAGNPLIGKDGIIGIKTGSIDQAKGNLLVAATVEVVAGKPTTIIGAIIGQPSYGTAISAGPALINSVKANLYQATPVLAGAPIARIAAPWGGQATATAKRGISFVAWKNTPIEPQITLQRAGVTYETGAAVGTVSATAGTGSGTSDVVMTSTLASPSFWWRLTRH